MTVFTPQALLAELTRSGTMPRLTWYGTGGERVELSGRVLANWVVKATNLLVEEADAAPGSIVGVHMPVHWRAAVWTLAAWTAGATVSLLEDESASVVTRGAAATAPPSRLSALATWAPGRTAAGERAGLVLAVALPGLARAWDGGPDGTALPAGAIDAAAEVLGYGDALGYTVAPGAQERAWGEMTFAELPAWVESSALQPGARSLITPQRVEDLLRDCLQAWQSGGSIVLLHPEIAGDPERRERIAREEQVA